MFSLNSFSFQHCPPLLFLAPFDAILNRYALRPSKQYWKYPRKAKIRILIEHPNPTFINEMQIKGIKITNPDPMIINES
jgi:hypothetical protein